MSKPCHFKKNFLSYEEAQKIVAMQYFNKIEHYRRWQNRPDNIPANPENYYRDKGWEGWRKWFGISKMSRFVTFQKAKDWALKNNIKNSREWRQTCLKYMPKYPEYAYKNQGWRGWHDFLGKSSKDRFLPFEEAREVVRALKLNSYYDFIKLKEKPPKVPANPNLTYRDKGWVDGFDWIGKPKCYKKKKFMPYEKAEKIVRALKLNTITEFRDALPLLGKIPFRPDKSYINDGWNGWDQFLGRNKD